MLIPDPPLSPALLTLRPRHPSAAAATVADRIAPHDIAAQAKERGEMLWSDQVFQWQRDFRPIEGFTLRAMRGKWQMDADQVPHAGVLNFLYTTTKPNTFANHAYRKELLQYATCSDALARGTVTFSSSGTEAHDAAGAART